MTNLVAQPDAQIQLTWTTPSAGVNFYDLRWSTSGPVTGANFASATPLGNSVPGYAISPTAVPVPFFAEAQGQQHLLVVTGLKPRAVFYWGLKSSDDRGTTWSAIDSTVVRPSAVASAFVLAASGLKSSGNNVGTPVLADADADGRLDILGVNNGAGNVNAVFRNTGNFNFTESGDSGVDGGTDEAFWADFDNDGKADFVEANNAGPIKVYRSNGDGTFTLVWTSTDVTPAAAIAVGDFDNDGRVDIAALMSSGIVKVYRNNGDLTFSHAWTSAETTLEGSVIRTADFDNDGRLDLIACTHPASGHFLILYRNLGSFSFSANQFSTNITNPVVDAFLFDVNNDGLIDIVARINTNFRVFLNGGGGSFAQASQFSVPASVGKLGAVADYNQDGLADILVGLSSLGANVLLNNGDGTFAAVQPVTTPDANVPAEAVSAGDLDGDGFFDLAQGNQSSASKMRVFRSLEGLFAAQVSTPSSPSGLAASLLQGGTLQLTWNIAPYEAAFSSRSFYFQVAAATCSASPCLNLDPSGLVVTSPASFVLSPSYGTPLLGVFERPQFGLSQGGRTLNWGTLSENVTYYFRVATIDSSLKRSSWSAELSLYVSEAPSAVVDIATSTVLGSDTSASLAWSATGDNSWAGTAASYDIRYSSSGAITAGNFPQASIWKPARAVSGPYGTAESETVSSLLPGVTYYFALKVRDAAGNLSGISNVVSYLTGKDVVPMVTAIAPADGSAGLSVSTTVSVQFTKSMSTASLAAAFTLTAVYDNDGNPLNQLVSGTTAFANKTWTFAPTSLLKNYTYRIQVTTAALDLIGRPILSAATAFFTTAFDHAAANEVRSAGVTLSIPAGAFASDGTVAISSGVQNAAVQTASQKMSDAFSVPVAVVDLKALDSAGNAMQPAVPLTAAIPYADANGDGIVDGTNPPVRAKTLALWWLDPASQSWLRVPGSSVDGVSGVVTAPVPHFSTFALIGGEDTSLADAHAFPVPYVPSKQAARVIRFVGLSSVATIKIYTVDGVLVRSLDSSDGSGTASWDVKDSSGRDAASGVYLYSVTNSRETATGKLVIVR